MDGPDGTDSQHQGRLSNHMLAVVCTLLGRRCMHTYTTAHGYNRYTDVSTYRVNVFIHHAKQLHIESIADRDFTLYCQCDCIL